jgi:RNA polymerase sigma-70 factor (ECF subfamily)
MQPVARDEFANSEELEAWLAKARHGSRDALGELLETCRRYLLLVANKNLPQDLQGRLGASDLVQETLFEAQRDFGQFQGGSREELLAWLGRILQHNLLNQIEKHRHAGKRSAAAEVSMADFRLHEFLQSALGEDDPPSAQARAVETDAGLERALAQLAPRSRQVIQLRSYERLSYQEIGEQLGCTAEAARKIWVRAIDELRLLLGSGDGTK